MKSIVVISDEPALVEILVQELPGLSVAGTTIQNAETLLKSQNAHLFIIDGKIAYHPGLFDNYIIITRPVRLKSLIGMIHEKLKNKAMRSEILLSPEFYLSFATRSIYSIDTTLLVTLTEKECELLQKIAERKDEILTRETLLKQIWGYKSEIDTHTLETHVYRLRSKLKQASEQLDIVFSEEYGYMLK